MLEDNNVTFSPNIPHQAKTIDRLKQFIDYTNMSLTAFDKKIGTGTGYMLKQIKKSGSVGSDILERIFSLFPEINPIWLLTGQGEMLNSDAKEKKELPALFFNEKEEKETRVFGRLFQKHNIQLIEAQAKVIRSLEKDIERKDQAIKTLEEKIETLENKLTGNKKGI